MHASVELVGAARGEAPWPIGVKESEWTGKVDGAAACGWEGGAEVVYAAEFRDRWDGTGGADDRGVIDCPRCLVLMREATDPVRYDYLRERGLVPELPLTEAA
jgi:hypothetical protein